MATLALRAIRKEYGKLVALDGLDLDVGDAEPNTRHVAMAFENYALYPQYSVYDNIAFPLRSKRYYRPPAEARGVIERVTTTLGIAHLLERMPRELSGGQRQRVALARVLVRPADILLLDEPLSHLDAKLRATMRAELKSLGDMQRTTSLYVTHDYLEALALGDRIAVLREGKLVQVGTREDLWHRPADIFVARAFGQPHINVIPGEMPGMLPIRGRVYVVEPLGRQREVTVEIGEHRVAIVTPHEDAAPGD